MEQFYRPGDLESWRSILKVPVLNGTFLEQKNFDPFRFRYGQVSLNQVMTWLANDVRPRLLRGLYFLSAIYIFIYLFPVRFYPIPGHGLLSRNYTMLHSDTPQSVGLLWTSDQPLPHNTQHSQQTDIHATGGIRTHNPSKPAAADPRLRPRGHWDRLHNYTLLENVHIFRVK